MLTYCARDQKITLRSIDEEVARQLVEDYDAALSTAQFRELAHPRVLALARKKGVSCESLPVYKIYNDLVQNLDALFDYEHGSISRMFD